MIKFIEMSFIGLYLIALVLNIICPIIIYKRVKNIVDCGYSTSLKCALLEIFNSLCPILNFYIGLINLVLATSSSDVLLKIFNENKRGDN